MKRRSWLGLVVAGASGLVLAGCETLGQQALRSKSNSEPPIVILADDKDKKDENAPSAENPTAGFFKPTRRSGAWSSEAAEIERELGVR